MPYIGLWIFIGSIYNGNIDDKKSIIYCQNTIINGLSLTRNLYDSAFEPVKDHYGNELDLRQSILQKYIYTLLSLSDCPRQRLHRYCDNWYFIYLFESNHVDPYIKTTESNRRTTTILLLLPLLLTKQTIYNSLTRMLDDKIMLRLKVTR